MRDDDGEEFNAATFWRAPVGPAPELSDSDSLRPTPPPEAAPEPLDPLAPQPRVTDEQASKLQNKVVPPRPKTKEMSTELIKDVIYQFQADFFKRYGRPVSMDDAKHGRLPVPILELYDELGSRLSPEQQAADRERAEARAAAREKAEADAHAAAIAKAAADTERVAAVKAAREREWAEFEANKEAAWASAAREAHEQREEVAGSAGVLALSGASTFVLADEPPRRQPTKEEYLRQMRDEFGIPSPEDGPSAAERAAERAEEQAWARNGGDEADDLASRDAWQRRQQGERQASSQASRVEATLTVAPDDRA
jgi:hypothetical protein